MRALAHFLLPCLIGGLLTASLWGGVAFWSERERVLTRRAAETETLNLAAVVDGHVGELIHSLDRTLLQLRQDWRNDPAGFPGRAESMVSAVYSDLVLQVGFTNRDGVMIFTTRDRDNAKDDVSDRDFFRVLADGGDRLMIGHRLSGYGDGGPSLVLSRPLIDVSGRFQGVLMFWVDPASLLQTFRPMEPGVDGEILVTGADGRTRTCTEPPSAERPCLDHFEDQAFIAAPAGAAGLVHLDRAIDGMAWSGAYRVMRDYPLSVLVLRTAAFVARPYEMRRAVLVPGVIVVSVVMLGVSVLIGLIAMNRTRLADQLAQQEERWRLALAAVGDGVWDWRPKSEGFAVAELGPNAFDTGASIEAGDWMARMHDDDRKRVLAELDDPLAGRSSSFRCEHRLVRDDGGIVWVLNRGVVLSRDQEGGATRMIGTLTDISERKVMETALLRQTEELARANGKLAEQAMSDFLTGVRNERGFLERAEEELSRRDRRDGQLALMVVAVDDFDQLNERRGRDAGDLVLRTVARRLQRRVRREDTLGRVRGAEFAILLPDTTCPRGLLIGESLRALIDEQPVVLPDGSALAVSVSIGLTCAVDERVDMTTLFARADVALAEARRLGRSRVCNHCSVHRVPPASATEA